MKLINQIDKANPCSELAIIVLVGYLLTSRYVQVNQTVATFTSVQSKGGKSSFRVVAAALMI
jgi:hypothetical protein